MGTSYSTLEEYGELVRAACEKPQRIDAHTCEYCDQTLIEFLEAKDAVMSVGANDVCLEIRLPGSIFNRDAPKKCPLSDYAVMLSARNRNADGSLSLNAILERDENESPTGFITKLAFCNPEHVCGVQWSVIGHVFCDKDSTALAWRLPRFDWTTSAGTQQHLKHVRALLQECTDVHKDCLQRPNQFRPRRLIEIPTDKKSSTVRVVETRGLPKAQWCALSYCWGGPQRERAIQGDFDNAKREKMVAIASLPKTVLDAILVAFELNIPYLWVDAFCILQDNLEDLSRELATMSQVYNRATLVITASKATSSTEGFLAPRPQPFKHNEYVVRVRYRTLEGISGTILLELNRLIPYTEPIDYRAWALQESILAHRQVRFENDGICWICPSDLCAGVTQNMSRAMKFIFVPTEELVWCELVYDYSNRKLTHSSDRLLALSAVAASYQSQEPENRYLAGLWKDHLPSSLFWYFHGTGASHRPKNYRAPSWSWASVDTNNRCSTFGSRSTGKEDSSVHGVSFSHKKLEIIDAFTDPAISHLPFGNARGGELIFNAPSLRLVLRSEPDSHNRDSRRMNCLTKMTHERSLRYSQEVDAGLGIYLDAPDDDFVGWGGDGEWEVFMPQACLLTDISAYYLLLRLVSPREERYQRVGLVIVTIGWRRKVLGPDHLCSLEPDVPDQRFVVV